MAVNYSTAVKTARMTATRDEMADGTIEIGTAGMATVLVTFGLSGTGGTIGTDTWTMALDAATVAATEAGGAAEAVVKDSVGTVAISGLTVGTIDTDVVLDNTIIAAGQNVTLNSATIQHA